MLFSWNDMENIISAFVGVLFIKKKFLNGIFHKVILKKCSFGFFSHKKRKKYGEMAFFHKIIWKNTVFYEKLRYTEPVLEPAPRADSFGTDSSVQVARFRSNREPKFGSRADSEPLHLELSPSLSIMARWWEKELR